MFVFTSKPAQLQLFVHHARYREILPGVSEISLRESLPRYNEQSDGICDYAKSVFAVGFRVLIDLKLRESFTEGHPWLSYFIIILRHFYRVIWRRDALEDVKRSYSVTQRIDPWHRNALIIFIFSIHPVVYNINISNAKRVSARRGSLAPKWPESILYRVAFDFLLFARNLFRACNYESTVNGERYI